MYFTALGDVCPGASTAAKGLRSQPVSQVLMFLFLKLGGGYMTILCVFKKILIILVCYKFYVHDTFHSLNKSRMPFIGLNFRNVKHLVAVVNRLFIAKGLFTLLLKNADGSHVVLSSNFAECL